MYEKIWNRDFILLTLSNFFMCITYYALISALPVYLVNELHAGKSQVGLVLAAYTIASVLIRPFSGFALDKFGRRTILLLALIFYTSLIRRIPHRFQHRCPYFSTICPGTDLGRYYYFGIDHCR